MTLMTGFLGLFKAVASIVLAGVIGFVMPATNNVSHIWSILFLISPVIILLYIILMAKVIKKRKTSKNLMIFYSFPFSLSLEILNDLNDHDLNDRIPWAIQGRCQYRPCR